MGFSPWNFSQGQYSAPVAPPAPAPVGLADLVAAVSPAPAAPAEPPPAPTPTSKLDAMAAPAISALPSTDVMQQYAVKNGWSPWNTSNNYGNAPIYSLAPVTVDGTHFTVPIDINGQAQPGVSADGSLMLTQDGQVIENPKVGGGLLSDIGGFIDKAVPVGLQLAASMVGGPVAGAAAGMAMGQDPEKALVNAGMGYLGKTAMGALGEAPIDNADLIPDYFGDTTGQTFDGRILPEAPVWNDYDIPPPLTGYDEAMVDLANSAPAVDGTEGVSLPPGASKLAKLLAPAATSAVKGAVQKATGSGQQGQQAQQSNPTDALLALLAQQQTPVQTSVQDPYAQIKSFGDLGYGDLFGLLKTGK